MLHQYQLFKLHPMQHFLRAQLPKHKKRFYCEANTAWLSEFILQIAFGLAFYDPADKLHDPNKMKTF